MHLIKLVQANLFGQDKNRVFIRTFKKNMLIC